MNMDVIRRCAIGALVILLLAGCEPAATTWHYKPPGQLPEQTDKGLSDDALLDALLADYERYDLPMPPPGAYLGLYTWSREPHSVGSQTLVWFDPGQADDGGVAWNGLYVFRPQDDLPPVEPTTQAATDFEIQMVLWLWPNWDIPFGAAQ